MKILILCLIGTFALSSLYSQESMTKNYWTKETAYALPKHSLEFGLLTASGYGITDNLELSVNSLLFFLMPKVKVKATWGDYSGFRLATEHGIFYPTPFMQLVGKKGTGGLISPEFKIPQMFAIQNGIRISYIPFKNAILTAYAGITFSVKFDTLDKRTTIDLPVIYPRLAIFYNSPEFDLGIDFRGKFIPSFGWHLSVENFIFCGTNENYFLENNGAIVYTSKKERLQLEAGYKLCFGEYPAGPQWHLLPLIDLRFILRK